MSLVVYVAENKKEYQAQVEELLDDDHANLMYFDENNALIHKKNVPRRTGDVPTGSVEIDCFYVKATIAAPVVEEKPRKKKSRRKEE